jgi:hypothetical protein
MGKQKMPRDIHHRFFSQKCALINGIMAIQRRMAAKGITQKIEISGGADLILLFIAVFAAFARRPDGFESVDTTIPRNAYEIFFIETFVYNYYILMFLTHCHSRAGGNPPF